MPAEAGGCRLQSKIFHCRLWCLKKAFWPWFQEKVQGLWKKCRDLGKIQENGWVGVRYREGQPFGTFLISRKSVVLDVPKSSACTFIAHVLVCTQWPATLPGRQNVTWNNPNHTSPTWTPSETHDQGSPKTIPSQPKTTQTWRRWSLLGRMHRSPRESGPILFNLGSRDQYTHITKLKYSWQF